MVFSSAIAAYGFARMKFPGRNVMFGVCLATMMIPFPVIMVPTYMIFKHLGWIGTFLPLWVARFSFPPVTFTSTTSTTSESASYSARIVSPAFTSWGTFTGRTP